MDAMWSLFPDGKISQRLMIDVLVNGDRSFWTDDKVEFLIQTLPDPVPIESLGKWLHSPSVLFPCNAEGMLEESGDCVELPAIGELGSVRQDCIATMERSEEEQTAVALDNHEHAEITAHYSSSSADFLAYCWRSDLVFVKVEFLRSLHSAGGRLVRRQELPEDACMTVSELLARNVSICDECSLGRILIISHPWFTVQHPDPFGKQLAQLVMELNNLGVPDSAVVFYDFCSLPQKPRSDKEDAQFREALQGLEKIFIGDGSDVLVLPQALEPQDAVRMENFEYTPNQHPYMKRGWCFFEFSIASDYGRVIQTPAVKGLEVDRAKDPAHFDTLFLQKEFTDKGDHNTVKEMYRRLYGAGRINDFERAALEQDLDGLSTHRGALKSPVADDRLRAANALKGVLAWCDSKLADQYVSWLLPLLQDPHLQVRFVTASLLHLQGKLAERERSREGEEAEFAGSSEVDTPERAWECAKLCEIALGKDHPKTFEMMEKHAHSLHMVGHFREEEKADLEIWERRRAALGEYHLDTISAMENYAKVLCRLQRDEEALSIRRQVWDLRKSTLGEHHLDTIMATHEYAISLSKVGRDEEALPIRHVAWHLRKNKLGENHLQTCIAMEYYAWSLSKLGRNDEALLINRQAWNLKKDLLGEHHDQTIWAKARYADSLMGVGRAEEARLILCEVLELRQATHGEDHPRTIFTMRDYAKSLSLLGQDEEALPILRKVVEWSKAVLGECHRSTKTAMSHYALSLGRLKREEEALQIFSEMVSTMQKLDQA